MSKSIFITGTGTDIGKTYVSALIMKKMINENMNSCYFKPVLSGAEKRQGRIYAGDIEYVKEISGLNEDTKNMGSLNILHRLILLQNLKISHLIWKK